MLNRTFGSAATGSPASPRAARRRPRRSAAGRSTGCRSSAHAPRRHGGDSPLSRRRLGWRGAGRRRQVRSARPGGARSSARCAAGSPSGGTGRPGTRATCRRGYPRAGPAPSFFMLPYFGSWPRVLRGDRRFQLKAGAEAQRVVDFLLGPGGDGARTAPGRARRRRGRPPPSARPRQVAPGLGSSSRSTRSARRPPPGPSLLPPPRSAWRRAAGPWPRPGGDAAARAGRAAVRPARTSPPTRRPPRRARAAPASRRRTGRACRPPRPRSRAGRR